MGSVQLRVFISHSDDDVEIAKPLITLLRNALNLRSEDIRCSSVDGYRLPVGASADEALRREVHDAELLIGLITPASITSVYVLFELGARWGARKPMFPLLASGATWEHLEGPLSSINALDCSNRSQVEQFIEEVAKELEVDPDRPAAYSAAVGDLVEASAAAEHVAEPSSGQLTPEASRQASAQPTVTHEGPALSEEAQRLLVEASKDNAGPIRKIRSSGGTHIQTRAKRFAEVGDRRSEALWEAAIEELIDHGLLQDPIGSDMMFQMTHEGFRVADELRASRSAE